MYVCCVSFFFIVIRAHLFANIRHSISVHASEQTSNTLSQLAQNDFVILFNWCFMTLAIVVFVVVFLFFCRYFFFVQINSTIFLAFCFSRFWVAHLWNFFVSFVLRTEHTDHEYRRSCENQFVANFTSTDDESEIWILCSCEAIKCLMQQIFSSVELFQAKSFAKTSIHWRIHSPKRPAAMSCSNAHTQKRNIFQFDFWFSFYFYCGQFVRFVRIEFSRCCFIADCRTSFSTSNLIFPSVSDFAAGSKW